VDRIEHPRNLLDLVDDDDTRASHCLDQLDESLGPRTVAPQHAGIEKIDEVGP
jgi:hypothetical protein